MPIYKFVAKNVDMKLSLVLFSIITYKKITAFWGYLVKFYPNGSLNSSY